MLVQHCFTFHRSVLQIDRPLFQVRIRYAEQYDLESINALLGMANVSSKPEEQMAFHFIPAWSVTLMCEPLFNTFIEFWHIIFFMPRYLCM